MVVTTRGDDLGDDHYDWYDLTTKVQTWSPDRITDQSLAVRYDDDGGVDTSSAPVDLSSSRSFVLPF